MRLKSKNITKRISDLIRKGEKNRGGEKAASFIFELLYKPLFRHDIPSSQQNTRVPSGAWLRHFEPSHHGKTLSWG
jgi:hypothetical protein